MSGFLRNLMAALVMALSLSGVTWADDAEVHCAITPSITEFALPASGLTWLPGEELSGACDKVPAGQWTHGRTGRFDLMVHADGPSGSGRYWTITVGLAPVGRKQPSRGVCLATSTVGWRTLQSYKRVPLPWIADLSGDGTAEVLIWGSFPLSDEPTMAEFGLVAWVYQLDVGGTFTIDSRRSRELARELADAYREPLRHSDQGWEELRAKAARSLQDFADGRCAPAPGR